MGKSNGVHDNLHAMRLRAKHDCQALPHTTLGHAA